MSAHPASHSFSLPFLDGSIRVGPQDTNNAFALLEMTMKPWSGPQAHVHRDEEEFFYVLAGSYDFVCGDEEFTCGPGELVRVPRGVPHRLSAREAGGRHLTLFQPAGPEGWFVEADSLARNGILTPETAAPLFDKYGMTTVPDPESAVD
jgi:mannose-6-phosphate isomerase-like protein (cupin superfamily)